MTSLTSRKFTKTTRDEVRGWLADNDLLIGAANIDKVCAAYLFANDEGTIQADKARELFAEPTYHTTMQLDVAAIRLGCKIQA